MHKIDIKDRLEKILLKIYKKNRKLHDQIMKKIREISNSPDFEHYKNLRTPLQHLKRVHIGHFVLIFKFDKKQNIISFENFKHHDQIYVEKW